MDTQTQTRISDLLKQNRVMVFMKGNPSFPACGFSARAVAILNEVGAKFGSVDVLEDESVRQGIKEFGNWPTIPQVYIDQKLVGGSDILMEMFETGELKKMLE